MKRINQISFDVWLTLLKSNPEFKLRKVELLKEKYNPEGLSFAEINDIMRNVDVQSTRVAEITERNFDPKSMIAMILIRMNNSKVVKPVIDKIHDEFQQLYLENLPFLYDENTKPVLEELNDLGLSLNVASNTGFIVGESVREALTQLGIYKYFDFGIFSDECGFAKPSSNFFSKVQSTGEYYTENILHVGDNEYADGFGAESFGIRSMIINSNNKSIKDVLTLIKQTNE